MFSDGKPLLYTGTLLEPRDCRPAWEVMPDWSGCEPHWTGVAAGKEGETEY